MENRIKECQLDLLADRTSTATMAANQLRLWFSSFAYVLLSALRRIGLPDTELAQATCGTIRPKLLKLGARVTVSVRRIDRHACTTPSSPRHIPGCARRPELHSRRRPPAPHGNVRPRRLAKVATSPQHRQHGKPPLRRQHHYRKIVSYHPIPPAKPASPGSR